MRQGHVLGRRMGEAGAQVDLMRRMRWQKNACREDRMRI